MPLCQYGLREAVRVSDLGESDSVSKNAIGAIKDVKKQSKEELVALVNKLEMAYAFSQRAAGQMWTDFQNKLKKCGSKSASGNADEPSDKKLEEEEKKIEREKGEDPAKDVDKSKETPEQKEEKKEFDKELEGVEKSAGVQ